MTSMLRSLLRNSSMNTDDSAVASSAALGMDQASPGARLQRSTADISPSSLPASSSFNDLSMGAEQEARSAMEPRGSLPSTFTGFSLPSLLRRSMDSGRLSFSGASETGSPMSVTSQEPLGSVSESDSAGGIAIPNAQAAYNNHRPPGDGPPASAVVARAAAARAARAARKIDGLDYHEWVQLVSSAGSM